MRIAFFGSPDVSTIPLRALVAAGHEIAIVVTQPDRRRGRGSTLVPTPVKQAAVELGLEVSHRMDDILRLDLDYAVVAAFGKLIPDRLLAHVEYLNIHPSLLPKWRGAAPVTHAILNGDTETGVCIMGLVKEMDAGPLYRVVHTNIADHEHVGELLPRLFELGSAELIEALRTGLGEPTEQVGDPSFAPKSGPDDTRLDWDEDAERLERVVRTDRAWTTFRGKRLQVLDARAHPGTSPGIPGSIDVGRVVMVAAGRGHLELLNVKPQDKAPLDALDWANGARIQPDDRLV